MKPIRKIICLAMLAIAILGFFLPVATFHDDTAASIAADIEKQQGKVTSAESQLQRWIDGGKKSEADIQKQRDKVQKEKDKLDALLAQQEAASGEEAGGLQYAFLPGKLPAELEVDMTVVNQYKLYDGWNMAEGQRINEQWNFSPFYLCTWAAFGALVLAGILIALTGKKEVNILYTIASFLQLIGILLAAYCIIRLPSIPVKLPYGSAQLHTIPVLMILCGSIVSFSLHVQAVHNSKRSMIYVFCIFLSALAIVPFWIMIVNATRSSAQIQNGVSLIPGSYLGNNWNVLATKGFNVAIGFKNSAIIAFGSTILSVYFSAMTAYGFKVYQFKGNKFLYAVVLAIIMIPGQVTGTGFFMFMYQLGWVDNRLALIIPSIAAASTVFFFRQYLEANLQISLVEAARIDGCGEFRTFNRIILPIMVPAMATMGIMAMIGAWNNYLTPLMLLSDSSLKTLPMMVNELRGDIYRTEYGSIYLGLTLTALPLLIVYFAFSKYIIAGVALGGVKE